MQILNQSLKNPDIARGKLLTVVIKSDDRMHCGLSRAPATRLLVAEVLMRTLRPGGRNGPIAAWLLALGPSSFESLGHDRYERGNDLVKIAENGKDADPS